MIIKIQEELNSLKNDEKAKVLQRFFKTGKGEYAENDEFLGVVVPDQRKIAKKYFKDVEIDELIILLKNKIHEYRLTALLILLYKYEKAGIEKKEKIFNFYLDNKVYVNNWDLVDTTCHHILGDFLLDKKKDVLFDLAISENFWFRRIAIVSCFKFIKNNLFDDAIKISKILLNDEHHLIHKAVGWMLREIGKRDIGVELDFLNKYHKIMPRIMLRYAIERFDKEIRKNFLKK